MTEFPALSMPQRRQASLSEFMLRTHGPGREPAASFDVGVCPQCGGDQGVIETRRTATYGPMAIRRVRGCIECHHRITTVEINAVALAEFIRGRDAADRMADRLRNLAAMLDGKKSTNV